MRKLASLLIVLSFSVPAFADYMDDYDFPPLIPPVTIAPAPIVPIQKAKPKHSKMKVAKAIGKGMLDTTAVLAMALGQVARSYSSNMAGYSAYRPAIAPMTITNCTESTYGYGANISCTSY